MAATFSAPDMPEAYMPDLLFPAPSPRTHFLRWTLGSMLLLLGCGENGMKLLRRLVAHGHRVVVVDDDAGVIERVVEMKVTGIRGDGADPDVLRAAGARHRS